MFVVFLKFSSKQSQAAQHMNGHKSWLQQGFDDGVFLMSGSLQARQGGALLAHNTSREELEARVRLDPFVTEDVVTAEITEFLPGKADARLQFLLEPS
ncbi:YciI family protein [Paucibacter sediminis]|uniref:YciI family protein n=1 Tax=Paucibacter sediminis TaxID=3019553 RepID=A0AA95NFJ9_9BURK|nr:YciI family protein [Paucibacter sp. S2-9]WIT14112.1 YciI family protein [Paucibacter sp. S2-9]